MSEPLLLGIDEGTSAVKAALFDGGLRVVASARREVPLHRPRDGWVEQDPELIVEAVVEAVAEVLGAARGREVVAAGLDHQGESVLAWDSRDGCALTQVIVWQDKRQADLLAEIDARDVAVSGLPLDPYFSAGRLAWLVNNDERVREAARTGSLRLGTVDAYITDRLGGRYASDLSTASRTQLLAAGGRDWDDGLLDVFGIRRDWLPALGPTFGSLGELRHERWPAPLPLAAQLVDQQAALAGCGAVRPGEVKATYGTGVFVLGLSAERLDVEGLLPTVAWAAPGAGGRPGALAPALDGGVFAAGSLLDWLAGGLGLADDAAALLRAAASVPDSAGVRVLPALAGLGAPWWRPAARGAIAGLHAGVQAGHVARAALEAIAWRVADVVEAIGKALTVHSLRVDGGLSVDETLLQIQADCLGLPLRRAPSDATVLGAAMLAGVGAGVFASVEQAAALLPAGAVVEPRPAARDDLRERRERWRSFVRAAAEL